MHSIPWLKPNFGGRETLKDPERHQVLMLYDAALRSGQMEPVQLVAAAYDPTLTIKDVCQYYMGIFGACLEAIEFIGINEYSRPHRLDSALTSGHLMMASYLLDLGTRFHPDSQLIHRYRSHLPVKSVNFLLTKAAGPVLIL